jgi:hypothetical protein
MDLDEQRAQLADRAPRRRRRSVEDCAEIRRRSVGSCRRAERIRHAREILHNTVVKIGGDPPPLVGGCLDRQHEQALALGVTSL